MLGYDMYGARRGDLSVATGFGKCGYTFAGNDALLGTSGETGSPRLRGRLYRMLTNPEENIYDRLKPDIFERIGRELKTAQTILDVGCGDCELVNFLARDTSNRIVGIDISDDDLERGRQEAGNLGTLRLVECKKADAHHLDGFDEGAFDAAVMVYALHEFDKPILVLRQVHRVLKDRGKLLIVDFLKGSIAEKLWQERYFSPVEVKSMLSRARFGDWGVSCPYGDDLLLFAWAKKSESEVTYAERG
jgi:SAM-dependent methyltransferase